MSNAVKAPFEEAMRAEGFTRKGDTWYLDCPEAILVTNLQNSQYGPSYYVNLALWIKAVGEARTPKVHQCHVRLRIEDLAGDEIERLLNLDKAMADDDRSAQIQAAMRDIAIPFLRSCGTVAGLKEQVAQGRLPIEFIRRRVVELINL